MERLTKYGKTSHKNGVCCTHFNSAECRELEGNCAYDCKWEEEVWSKLAHYEDLEEQGRLIELPCVPNETVWYSDEYDTRPVLYGSKSSILYDIECGKGIGYTKEEAEEKLKEMKEGVK